MSKWHERRKQRNHKVLPGFPWEGKFQTQSEIDAYFDGDTVQCLLCGRELKELGGHLQIHNISPEDYKKRYGLPWSRGLESHCSKNSRREAALERMERGQVPYITDDNLRPKGLGIQQREKQPFDKNRIVQQALRIHNKPCKWEEGHYEAILHRMQRQKRLLEDVCKDEDIPSLVSWNRFCQKHPELKFMERAQAIHNMLPYSLQAKSRKFPMSPQFKDDCHKLHQKGLTYGDIGKKLGVSSTAVRYALVGDPRKK